jgi:hypothetical protein
MKTLSELRIMKYDTQTNPIGSLERAKAQFRNGDLIKALKTCRLGGSALDLVKPELDECIAKLHSQRNYGVILSGYYNAGVVGKFSVAELLKLMWQARDIPSFLKQAYRFDALDLFKQEIEEALFWHESKRLPDAFAWRMKFKKLGEQRILKASVSCSEPVIEVLEDIEDEPLVAPAKLLSLRPIAQDRARKASITQEAADDPYIISKTARVKIEQANREHIRTLAVLTNHLRERGKEVSSSKLIDAFSILTVGAAIFEVKSITESNERDQVRHALSQLYEYRYLHQKPDATLWVVFSREPFSSWIVDYLISDREVRVVWSDANGHMVGPSSNLLE